MFELTQKEHTLLKKLSTPAKIQDYLNALPFNFEPTGDTCGSPRRVIREKSAHCIEGAFLAATALSLHGEEPLIMDLKTMDHDDDHVVALYKQNGFWGALSKTNHGVLRYRDPIYRTPRELALSYFHEYFFPGTGEKTLLSYSKPLNLKRFGTQWMTSEDGLWFIAVALDDQPHYPLVPKKNRRLLRRADPIELKTGSIPEWKKHSSKR